jgi:hypothetical protein
MDTISPITQRTAPENEGVEKPLPALALNREDSRTGTIRWIIEVTLLKINGLCRRGDLTFRGFHESVTCGSDDRTERIERIKRSSHTHSAHTPFTF